jgi:hypothetical protein
MGEPSREQIDEAIAWGLANRWSEQRLLKHLATLERMTDEELAAFGIVAPEPAQRDAARGPESCEVEAVAPERCSR